jgi:dTDP-L-rhamnose 4-epimerase
LDLPIFEDGLESRDFVHVADVAKAVQLGIEAEPSPDRIYNVGSGIPTSVMEIAHQLCTALNGNSQVVVTSQYRVGDIRHCYADMSRIKLDLGFVPSVSLKEGLHRFASWVLTQPLPEDQLDRANQELKAHKLMG